MAPDESPSTEEIEARLHQIGRYSRLSRAGLWVIGGAFALAVVGRLPYSLESVPSAVDAILLPTIFVGMGLLLYAIGMHLHLMHLNLVKGLQQNQSADE